MTRALRFAFRTDASAETGTGHVVRCLALANELRASGGTVRFLCREITAGLAKQLGNRGHELAMLPAGASDWQHDADASTEILRDRQPWDWLIVDHYGLDARWEKRARRSARRILAIDDLADRPHDCDLLLDQNYYHDADGRYDGLVPPGCNLLLGPRYALLREEFATACRSSAAATGTVRRLFVCFGGIDAGNETAKAIRAIRSTALQVEVDVVIGDGNPHRVDIQRLCGSDSRFHFHCQAENMAELMAEAGLAIGACGTTAWERCALGLPALVVVVADNQARAARDLARAGACLNLGNSGEVSASSLRQSLLALVADAAALRRMSANARALMAGERGAVARELREASVD
jgi:UDP-2,4-diacetamido-2,4,6-trideoxy-beta-L-altropyranose hydrolase